MCLGVVSGRVEWWWGLEGKGRDGMDGEKVTVEIVKKEMEEGEGGG